MADQLDQPSSGTIAALGSGAPIREICGFELIERIGQGGMGTVFRARQKSLDRSVALKILPPSIAQNARLIERFQREARASARLVHPNIVQGIDVGQDPKTGLWYFAMEFVDGPSLKQVLKEEKVIPEERALTIIREIARALEQVAANNMVHRDIKPDNILLDRRGTPKLADLGLAKQLADDASLTQAGQAIGTPNYMAPEQVRGAEEEIDIRTDLYALGATLFHLVTGRTPFVGPTSAVILSKHLTEPAPLAHKTNTLVSEACGKLIARLMEKNPDHRIQSPTELLQCIEKILKGNKSASKSGARSGVHQGVTTGPRSGVHQRVTTGPRPAVGKGASGYRRAVDTDSTGPLPPTLRRSVDTGSTGPLPPAKSGPRPAVGKKSSGIRPGIDTAPTASMQPLTTSARAVIRSGITGTMAASGSGERPAVPAKKGALVFWSCVGAGFVCVALLAVFSSSGKQRPPQKAAETYARPPSPLPPPAPIARTPTVAPEQTPLREERAKAMLSAALELQKNSTADFGALLAALEKAGEQARGTALERQAGDALSAAQARWAEALDGVLKPAGVAAAELSARNDFAGALEKLTDDVVPANLRLRDWQGRLEALRRNVNDAAEAAAAKIVEEARARAQAGDSVSLAAAVEQLQRLDAIAQNVPSKAKAADERARWLAALEQIKKAEAAAQQARAEKARELIAAVRNEVAPLLQQNKYAAASELLDNKLRDRNLADAEALLKQDKADVATVLALRQSAIAALRKLEGKTVKLKKGNSAFEGVVLNEPSRQDLMLRLANGPEISLGAEHLDVGDVDTHAPAAKDAEDQRRRGLLFLAAGSTDRAKEYFLKAQAAGLGDAIAPYLERIEIIEWGEIEIRARKDWTAAEALFAAKQWKEAQAAYAAFQTQHAKTKSFALSSALLKERLAAIDTVLTPHIPGLVLWLKLDEKDGAKAANSVEKGATADVFGGQWLQDGKSGGALQFNGKSDYLITSNNVGGAFTDGDVTIAVWIKPAGGGVVADEVGQHAPGGIWHDSQIEVMNDGEVKVRVWQLPGLSAGRVQMNEWHHVVMRYSKKERRLDGLVDGVKSEGKIDGDKQWSAETFYAFGSADSTHLGHGGFFKGAMDDVRVYNRALTEEEVRVLAGTRKQ